MYSAIDQVMDKIETQVKRHLSKTRDHRSDSIRNEEDQSIEESDEVASVAQDEPVILSEEMISKPMDPEEAAIQLDFSRRGFLVFRNAKSREINVIYKRGDGNLGLVEPRS